MDYPIKSGNDRKSDSWEFPSVILRLDRRIQPFLKARALPPSLTSAHIDGETVGTCSELFLESCHGNPGIPGAVGVSTAGEGQISTV